MDHTSYIAASKQRPGKRESKISQHLVNIFTAVPYSFCEWNPSISARNWAATTELFHFCFFLLSNTAAQRRSVHRRTGTEPFILIGNYFAIESPTHQHLASLYIWYLQLAALFFDLIVGVHGHAFCPFSIMFIFLWAIFL